MSNMLKNNKGVVLLLTYSVLVALLGLSAVSFLRAINENRLAQRSNHSLEAFYAAEAGLAYAYAEVLNTGFSWYTHVDKDRPVTVNNLAALKAEVGENEFIEMGFPVDENDYYDYVNNTVPPSMPGANTIEIDTTTLNDKTAGCYYVNDAQGNRRFMVKCYPEVIDGAFNNTVVILSEAEASGSTRAIEYRLGRTSAYKFLFFFPEDHTFSSDTFNGLNYGGIHVNGDIRFTGYPRFYFLTELSSGSENEGKGYILRPLRRRFYDCRGNTRYDTRPSDPYDLSYYMYRNTNYHFYTGNTYFRTGEEDNYTQTTLPYYLEGSEASWEFDKYDGNSGDRNDKLPLHYTLDNDDLKNLGIFELCRGEGSVALLDESYNVSFASYSGNEEEVFKQLYNKDKDPDDDDDDDDDDDEYKAGLWNQFWTQWKENHANDASYTDGRNWERRFYRAAYNWRNPETPYGVNMEWWQDLSYGDDRSTLSNDMVPAEVVSYSTGEELDQYFLNTKEQASVWGGWLDDHNLDGAGENQTLVQDRSQGGKYLNPVDIIGQKTQYSQTKDKAKKNGVYIGLNDQETTFLNPIADCTVEIQFYNSQHPARSGNLYQPSKVLVIDVKELNDKIDSGEMPNFNGIVYIDLEGKWASTDPDADAVMLVNGERLPDAGLSIVTPNNVYIKGSYNLDPTGCPEKNREPDLPAVISRVTDQAHYSRIDGTSYTVSESDLVWQPADIITSRVVYTLSEDFPEPSYMPMGWSHNQQYYEERDYAPEQDFVSGNASYPTDDWVPSPSETYSARSRVNQWFTYYAGGQTLPSQWSASWIYGNWPSNEVFALDTDGDNTPDTYILSRDLRNDVYYHIESEYDSAFSYTAIHGDDGASNPNTPSQNNRVTEKHIYNAAIVTPYNTSPYVLEYWGSTDRIINGAFIQLPGEEAKSIPRNARYGRTNAPDNFFKYECRFGKNSNTEDQTPASPILSSSDSWREISSAKF